jgi:hypothetical protein
MKRKIIITGMALVILAAFTGSLDAQRGMRGMHGMQMHHRIAGGDSLRMNMMRQGMMPGRQFMGEPRPGMRIIETIPDLTDKQKKDIADLRVKQQEEMKKFREDMSAKMNTIREANKAKIMNLLTDEQKKYLEGNKPAAPEKK